MPHLQNITVDEYECDSCSRLLYSKNGEPVNGYSVDLYVASDFGGQLYKGWFCSEKCLKRDITSVIKDDCND